MKRTRILSGSSGGGGGELLGRFWRRRRLRRLIGSFVWREDEIGVEERLEAVMSLAFRA